MSVELSRLQAGTFYIKGIVLRSLFFDQTATALMTCCLCCIDRFYPVFPHVPCFISSILVRVYGISHALNIATHQARSGLYPVRWFLVFCQCISSARYWMTPCLNRRDLVLEDQLPFTAFGTRVIGRFITSISSV